MGAGQSLDDVRREIDAIDDSIHDLIMRRTALVEKVRDLKRDSTVRIRPSREAEIIHRLLRRHKGNFPRRELVALWRQLICATLPFEGPFSVAVYVPEAGSGHRDLARDHFGTFTPMTRHSSVRAVIEAVSRQDATVGVLPMPRQDDTDPWWCHLVAERADAPRIIARLPFAGPANGTSEGPEALVICPVGVRSTGRDRFFLAVDSEKRLGLNQFRATLEEVGFIVTFSALWREEQGPRTWLYLAEVDGYVAEDDPGLGKIQEALGSRVNRIVRLGGYAAPLTTDELGPPASQMARGTGARR